MDDRDHGTHVARIIGAIVIIHRDIGTNQPGMMALKFMKPQPAAHSSVGIR
jgi:hypothetical protein